MSSDGPRQPEPAGDPRARVRADLEAAAGEALIAALNARENYTAAHSEAVVELALAVGAELELELGEVALREIGQVALLHDIGKVGVPDAILQKEGALTAPEWEVMRGHPAIGARIVGAIGSLAHLSPAIRAEHERWDGAGYPDGLAGTEIPLASRICFMCDAWHAMTSDRPYRQALPPEAARDELERHVGSQFCPGAAPALLRVLDRLDTPAQVVSDLGVVLVQNPLAEALLGVQTEYSGLERSVIYRWFTDPEERRRWPREDHPIHSRSYAASLRAAHGRDPDGAQELVDALLRRSPEFAELWERHEVGERTDTRKRIAHPAVGLLALEDRKSVV